MAFAVMRAARRRARGQVVIVCRLRPAGHDDDHLHDALGQDGFEMAGEVGAEGDVVDVFEDGVSAEVLGQAILNAAADVGAVGAPIADEDFWGGGGFGHECLQVLGTLPRGEVGVLCGGMVPVAPASLFGVIVSHLFGGFKRDWDRGV